MLSNDWIAIAFCLIGLLSTASSAYTWRWFWRLAKIYLPREIGIPLTRFNYLGIGTLSMTMGISLILSPRMGDSVLLPGIIGLAVSTSVSAYLYSLKRGQSIMDVFEKRFYEHRNENQTNAVD